MRAGLLRLDGLVLDPTTQIRSATSPATVSEYRDAMRGGAEFPPVTVVAVDPQDDSKGFVLIDGWHRVLAAQQLGRVQINVDVIPEQDARRFQWLAAEANRRHGLRLARSDRRRVFQAYVRAGEHRHNNRGNRVKSAREMARDLQGIVSDRRIPEWMRQDFPKVYEAMRQGGLEENPGADFGKRDPDERHVELANASLDQFMAAFRAIEAKNYRNELLMRITETAMGVATVATGSPTLPVLTEEDF